MISRGAAKLAQKDCRHTLAREIERQIDLINELVWRAPDFVAIATTTLSTAAHIHGGPPARSIWRYRHIVCVCVRERTKLISSVFIVAVDVVAAESRTRIHLALAQAAAAAASSSRSIKVEAGGGRLLWRAPLNRSKAAAQRSRVWLRCQCPCKFDWWLNAWRLSLVSCHC